MQKKDIFFIYLVIIVNKALGLIAISWLLPERKIACQVTHISDIDACLRAFAKHYDLARCNHVILSFSMNRNCMRGIELEREDTLLSLK